MSPRSKYANPPRRVLALRNRQRDCGLNRLQLRRFVRFHLQNQLGLHHYDLSIHLLPARQMAEANEAYLRHPGPTDVITFDYREPDQNVLWGELLVCPAVAIEQARDFGTSWQSEILRYIIHGVLHLRGFDDRTAADRRVMKREEDRLLSELTETHAVRLLGVRSALSRKRPLESGGAGP